MLTFLHIPGSHFLLFDIQFYSLFRFVLQLLPNFPSNFHFLHLKIQEHFEIILTIFQVSSHHVKFHFSFHFQISQRNIVYLYILWLFFTTCQFASTFGGFFLIFLNFPKVILLFQLWIFKTKNSWTGRRCELLFFCIFRTDTLFLLVHFNIFSVFFFPLKVNVRDHSLYFVRWLVFSQVKICFCIYFHTFLPIIFFLYRFHFFLFSVL